MKIKCNANELNIACQNVQKSSATKATLPALEGFLLKAENNEIIITGYNLEMGIITKINAEVKEIGSIVLNAKVLCGILKNLPKDEVEITVNKTTCKIVCGNVKYEVKGI